MKQHRWIGLLAAASMGAVTVLKAPVWVRAQNSAEGNGANVSGSVAASAPMVIADFKAPFLFAYGSWDKKVGVENGRARLRGEGVTGQGGAGANGKWNLSAEAAEYSPALRLKVGQSNKVPMLKLMLRDSQERVATYEFSLPAAGTDWTLVAPREGAPLSRPNATEKGVPDFADIMQWQLIGDWNAGPLDVEVQSVELTAATDEIRAARQQNARRLADEAEKLRQERVALQAKYSVRSNKSPSVASLSPVAPDVLALQITSGRITPSSLSRYVKQAGDATEEKKDDRGRIQSMSVKRGGSEMGWLIGPQRDWIVTREQFEGDPLLEWIADDAANFSISSPDDADFAQAIKPISIGRKSKPTNWELSSADMEMLHTIYLRLPKSLKTGKKYTVNLGALNTRQSRVELVNDASKVLSEAIHVNQIGYRPDDPAKRAFVSCWMGTGGALKLPPSLNFSLLDDKGRTVFKDRSSALWPADKPELMQTDRNFNGTDVARLDFSSFQKPGRYRVSVEGIGVSLPFEIEPNVWQRAFLVQMKGLYHQRSGVALGPLHSDFVKPRDMNPADAARNGTRVTWTKYRAVEAGGEAGAAISKGDTGVAAPGWGGYQDAGDWNPRRVTHMKVTLAQLEVFDLFPKYFASLKLGIPPRPGVPDILTEAIFEFECFHRLQQKNGGVGYGLETDGDPAEGEVSWLQSFPIYAFAPDYSSSWFYATVGARLSRLLQPYDAKLAASYRASAVAAFNWAETDWARDKAAGLTDKRGEAWVALDNRNLAALELYRLTRDKKWHDVFLQNSVLVAQKPEVFQWGKAVQRDQAFHYARLPQGLGDAALKQKAGAAVREMAERSLTYASNNAWNLTTPDKGKPQFLGFYSTPDATDLVHAHALSGETKYLAGALQATQFQSGGNPNNLVYTSGLGANPVKNSFKLDARRTGQAVPAGLTPYGNVDFSKWGETWIMWPITYFLSKTTTPHPLSWPTSEAYWDLGGWPALNEFTVDSWAPNVAVWGYLAARQNR